MDAITQVSVFLEVAKHQSFAEAARRLMLPASSVTKYVQALEQRLGAKLLHRTTRRVTLTDAGALYQHRAGQAMEALEAAAEAVKVPDPTPSGGLTLSLPRDFGHGWLAEAVAVYAGLYPQVALTVQYEDRYVDLLQESIDLAVRLTADAPGPGVEAVCLSQSCPLLWCASPDYLEAHGEPMKIAELNDHALILKGAQGQAGYDWVYQNTRGEQGAVHLTPKHRVNSYDLAAHLAKAGQGVALLPVYSAAPYLDAAELHLLLPQYRNAPDQEIQLLFPEALKHNPKVQMFIHVVQRLAEERWSWM